jgi:hypothetical protein
MQNGGEAEPLDRLFDLFASSDAILASQFFGLRKSAPSRRPIQRLMLAILVDALDCFRNYAGAPTFTRRGRLHSEAASWLFDGTAEGPCSFAWVCLALEIDPSYLRAGIRRLEARMRRGAGSSNGL